MGPRHIRPTHPDLSSFLVNDADSILFLFYCTYRANESPLAVLGGLRLQADRLSHIALTLAGAKKRTLKTGRGHFKDIMWINRVIDAEHGRESGTGGTAIVDICAAIGSVDHDLQCPARRAVKSHPDDLQPHALGHWLGNREDSLFEVADSNHSLTMD